MWFLKHEEMSDMKIGIIGGISSLIGCFQVWTN